MVKDILILLFAHMVGDYIFQNNFIATIKATNNFILFVHSFLWAGTIAIGFHFIGIEINILLFSYLVIRHFLIDKMKCNKKDKTNALTTDLYVDQLAHILDITIVWMALVWIFI